MRRAFIKIHPTCCHLCHCTDNAYKHITTSVVGCDAHQDMSLNAARKGMVLLKQGPLPFKKGQNIAVLGRTVNSMKAMTGNYGWGFLIL